MIQSHKTQKRLNAEGMSGKDKELLYLTTLSYAKIMQRRWQMNKV